MKNIKHVELFAGIGGFRKGIDLFANDNGFNSICLGYSEFDKYAEQTYCANFDNTKVVSMGDIVEFNNDSKNIEKLGNFNVLTGGFPCQPFSSMGNKQGLADERGNLFYEIVKIIKAKNPNIVLLENVRNFKNHDDGNTFKTVRRILEKECGYSFYSDVFNTANFGLPQDRRRVYMLAIKNGTNKNFEFTQEGVLEEFQNMKKENSLYKYKTTKSLLSKKVDEKYYLSEKIKKTILSSGTGGFYAKPEINKATARTLTATMVKMHRAGQDNYFSDEYIDSKIKEAKQFENFVVPKNKYNKYKIRKITPMEGLLLQGFDKSFYKSAKESQVSDTQLYKQIGNAVSVNVVYAIFNFLKIKQVGIFK